VQAFRTRPLEGRYPYLWLDAKVEKVRDGGRLRRKCLVSPTASTSLAGAR
jgi:putative transposase